LRARFLVSPYFCFPLLFVAIVRARAKPPQASARAKAERLDFKARFEFGPRHKLCPVHLRVGEASGRARVQLSGGRVYALPLGNSLTDFSGRLDGRFDCTKGEERL
jgi:hypothetical protein